MNNLLYKVNLLDNLLSNLCERLFPDEHLTLSQYVLLLTINKYKDMNIAAVGRKLGIKRVATWMRCRSIEGAGLIEKFNLNKRESSFILTEKGHGLLKKYEPLVDSIHQKIIERLGPIAYEELLKELTTVNDICHIMVKN